MCVIVNPNKKMRNDKKKVSGPKAHLEWDQTWTSATQGQLRNSEVKVLSSSIDNNKPFLRGLLKNAFMPALRQSFFVES